MFDRIAFLSIAAAALGAAALPHAAAAADYYDEGRSPFAFHSQDDVEIDGDRARFAHRLDLRPVGGALYRRSPGPVVYDERGPAPRYARPAYGYDDPAYGRPVAVERPVYGYGGAGAYGARFDRPDGYGVPDRPVPAYRPVSAPVYGGVLDARDGLPDVGCTTEQAQSTTPAGWRKIVTHRTCYRR